MPTILTCAVTGNHTTRDQNPTLPVTPKEIAEAAIAACEAGAAIAHIHVRDPESGAPSMKLEHYREVVDRIRDSGCGIIINLTTGPGGRYSPTPGAPGTPGPGTSLLPPLARVEHVLELRPEICTLDLNTMWFGKNAVINAPDNVREMAGLMRKAGVLPELEVFDTGDVALAKDLIADGTLAMPSLFQIVLGVKYGVQASAEDALHMRHLLPVGAPWACFGIGRHAFRMLAMSCVMGGHCRIGMEDTVHLSKGVLTQGNRALVEKARRIIEDLGGEVATPDQARALLPFAAAT